MAQIDPTSNVCIRHNEPHCQNCTKKTDNIFCHLPIEALKLIDEGKITKIYKKNEFLFLTGDNPNGIFCVNTGTVKLETEGPRGHGHILRIVQGGGVLGYRSLFADEPYQGTAIAMEPSVVCHIPKSIFINLIKSFRNYL